MDLLHEAVPCVISNPVCHVVISVFPVDAAGLIAEAAKKRGIVFRVVGVGACNNSLHVSNTVKSTADTIKPGNENLRSIGGSNQWICNIGTAQKLAGNRFHSECHGLRT